jgi:hypothetical protein
MKQITIGKDGTAITAKFEDFINLQESDCGFGDTEKEALIDLFQQSIITLEKINK